MSGAFPGATHNVPKYNTPITPKENVRRAVDKTKPLWFPMSRDFMDYEPRINKDTVARAMIIDMGDDVSEESRGGIDFFGVDWVYVPSVGGSMPRPGVKPLLEDVNDWPEKIVFPNLDELDWKACAEQNIAINGSERALHTSLLNGLFERLISFMEFENAALAIIDEDQQDAIHALFDRLVDMYIEILDRHLEYAKLDGLLMHDDWGSQRAPFFSPKVCREMIAPHLKRFVDYVHSKGLWFELHSCGLNEILVPVMIECGVDIWRPQHINDVAMLHEKYGDKIVFGLPFPERITRDTPDDELNAKVKAFVEKYAPTFHEKPFLVSAFGVDQRFHEAMYRESRIALNKYWKD